MISVGLPIVKTEFLKEALKSIQSQTYEDFELIILNNGKTKRKRRQIKEKVQKYSPKEKRYYENNEQLPIIENWNKCLSYAKGEYFVLFSDDDMYEPKFLEELHNLAQQYPKVDLLHTRVRIINEEGDTVRYSPICPEFESGLSFLFERLQGYRLQFAPDFMSKTKTLISTGGFHNLPLAWGSDDITWFKLARAKGVAYSSKPLCNWRKSNSNLSATGDSDEKLQALEKYFNWVEDNIEDFLMGVNGGSNEKEIRKLLKVQNQRTHYRRIQNILQKMPLRKLVLSVNKFGRKITAKAIYKKLSWRLKNLFAI